MVRGIRKRKIQIKVHIFVLIPWLLMLQFIRKFQISLSLFQGVPRKTDNSVLEFFLNLEKIKPGMLIGEKDTRRSIFKARGRKRN